MKSERFSTEDEIKRALGKLGECEGGGPVAYTENGDVFVYNGEGHTIRLGISGSGKSRRGTYLDARSIIEAGESGILIDPKAELWRNLACYSQKSHDVRVINFRNPKFSQSWNPLAYPLAMWQTGERGQAQMLVQEIVLNLTNTNRSSDQFWIDSERSLMSGLINLLMEYAPEHCSFPSLQAILRDDWNSLSTNDQNVSGGYLADIVETLPTDSTAKQLLSSYTALTARTTKSCIMSEVTNTITKFCTTEDVADMISSDDLDIANLNTERPFMIFVIIPDDSPVFATLSGLLVTQIASKLIRLADLNHDGRLPIRVNFILEELGSIGHSIPNLAFLMSAGRSRQIRMVLILQALEQLDSTFGSSRAEIIRSNANLWICLKLNSRNTLSELSWKCGNKIIQAGNIYHSQPLLSEQQLMALPIGTALVFINGERKFVHLFEDYTAVFDCSDLMEIPIAPTKKRDASKSINLVKIKNKVSASKRSSAGSRLRTIFEEGE